MRTQSHISDSKSIKRILILLPDEWVVRHLTERDYGIDLEVEIFQSIPDEGKKKGRFDSTGHLALLQLKGTQRPVKLSRDGSVHVYVERKLLRYAENFATPVFLVRVDASGRAKAVSYFVWLQRYISDVIDIEEPHWRDFKGEDDVTVRIPAKNMLPDNAEKIARICRTPKYADELLEFSELYFAVSEALDQLSDGTCDLNQELLNKLQSWARRITRLRTLIANNDCGVDQDCALQLLDLVSAIDVSDGGASLWVNFPQRDALDRLAEVRGNRLVETFVAELTDDTVY